MSIDSILRITSDDSEQTERIGAQLARNLQGGEVIELRSDVGGGKTTLVRGLARGIGINEPITSPTFTVSREYQSPARSFVHFDLYRMQEVGVIAHLLAERAHDPSVITCIEWAGEASDVLPKERVVVTIEKHPTDEQTRHITIEVPPSLAYVTKGISV